MTRDNTQRANGTSEAGYVLIITIGALTVLLILITGILPSVAQEAKRERETEMLFRGRQIVDGIARYRILLARSGSVAGVQQGVQQGVQPGVQSRTGTPVAGLGWPQSLQQLADGINLRGSTRRVRVLRPFALKDPMNHDGPWKPVGFNDPALREFLKAYFEAQGQSLAAWPPQFRVQYLGATVDLGDKDDESQDSQKTARLRSAFGGVFNDGEENKRPNFIFGVVSENAEQPLRDYYGLERYDQWVFAYIPELQSVSASNDEQVRMLSREILFPTDPLALVQLGLGGSGAVNKPATVKGDVTPAGAGPGVKSGSKW
jgi:hypothetical protein